MSKKLNNIVFLQAMRVGTLPNLWLRMSVRHV